jgi:glycogen synthase
MALSSMPDRRPGTRGRVVMLTDNDVRHDSRVQREARSAAQAGWDVVLLGRSRDKERHTWSLGDARVTLLPVSRAMTRSRYEFRRAPLRWPLAYRPTGIAAHRMQLLRARRADLALLRDELAMGRAAGGSSWAGRVDRRLLTPSIMLTEVASRWVALRSRQTERQTEARQNMDSRLDRFTTAFWIATKRDRAWRRLDPHLWSYDVGFGPVVDDLAPDLIHANDFRMLGVGARAALRARGGGRTVKLVWDAHDFLPGIDPPAAAKGRWHAAQRAYEREYAPYADVVVTVSEGLADLLVAEHGLARRPTVVLNTPDTSTSPADSQPVPKLRELCGIDTDVPLVVYSGPASLSRGTGILIETMPRLPGVHVALAVPRTDSTQVMSLVLRARELGVADRLHVLPYVPYDQVIAFLASADAGVIPIHHCPNHEISLTTTFFEYSHARLPIVVSDVKVMAEMTRKTGQGEVFRAEDPADFLRAVQAVLADPNRYRDAYETPGLLDGWTWTPQAAVLDAVYSRLLPDRAPAPVTS